MILLIVYSEINVILSIKGSYALIGVLVGAGLDFVIKYD
jgi:hypothetical protein